MWLASQATVVTSRVLETESLVGFHPQGAVDCDPLSLGRGS